MAIDTQDGTSDDFDLFLYSGDVDADLSPSQPSSFTNYGQAPKLQYELPYALNIWGALYVNGEILGLGCTVVVPAKSLTASPDVPLPLQPTTLQLQYIHFTGIDRLPFPKMRDNFIKMSAVLDEEDLVRDICLGSSFSITPGSVPWNPAAWKIEKPFADKWGFLFC